MEAVYTEPIKTPMAFEKAHECLKWALNNYIGNNPEDEVLALALAKTALETGRWTSIWNSNWGNVKASDTYVGMYTCIVLNEVLMRNGKPTVVWFAPEGELSASPAKGGKLIAPPLPVPPGHVQTRMRAFANNYDGADQYVDFVAQKSRYRKAWAALLTGNAVAYVHQLRVAGYFTAPESEYLSGVAALQNEFLRKIRGMPEEPPVDMDWEKLTKDVYAQHVQFITSGMDEEFDEDTLPNA